MKVRYNLFLMVIGCIYFPYFSQAVTLPNASIVLGCVERSPRLLHAIQNGYNTSPSSKVDEAALLRKIMRTQALIQRVWLTTMVVPGLGQVYNKDYWKVPCLYLGFILVGFRIYLEHQEMNKHKRTLLMVGDDQLNPAFSKRRIKECERARDLFIMIASAWYLLNIFDAYAGGHDKTINFKYDIEPKSTSKSTAVLQPTTTVR